MVLKSVGQIVRLYDSVIQAGKYTMGTISILIRYSWFSQNILCHVMLTGQGNCRRPISLTIFQWLSKFISIKIVFRLGSIPVLKNITDARRAQQSSYVQNFSAITGLRFGWEVNEIPSNLNYDYKHVFVLHDEGFEPPVLFQCQNMLKNGSIF